MFPVGLYAGIRRAVMVDGLSRREAALNRPGFTGGQNSRRIAHYGTDTKEEDLEAVFP